VRSGAVGQVRWSPGVDSSIAEPPTSSLPIKSSIARGQSNIRRHSPLTVLNLTDRNAHELAFVERASDEHNRNRQRSNLLH
jgi:hypothetical protein